MNKRKKERSIKITLILVIVCIALVTGIGIEGFSVYSTIRNNQKQAQAYQERLIEDVQNELEHEVDVVWSLIDTIHTQQEAGVYTEEEAKKLAADLTRELRYDDGNGYFWIDTTEGVNVVLLGRDTEGSSRYDSVDPNGVYYVQEILNAGMQDGGGFAYYSFAKDGGTEPLPKMSYSLEYEPYDWVIGTGVWIDDIDEEVENYTSAANQAMFYSIVNSIVFLVILLIILIVVAMFIGNSIAAPIKVITKDVERMASGDFSAVEETKERENMRKIRSEIGTMSNAGETLQSSIRDLMNRISESTDFVASASEELNATAGQSADASGMVAESCTNVAGSCNDQMSAVTDATNEVEAFSENMDEFSNTIESFGETIKATNEAASTGITEIQKAIDQMQKIEESVSASSEAVASLGDQIATIGTIVDTISDIAGQTDLLSLNASIEAARAGEAGKGFAVVADEIRHLSDETNSAAMKITEMINSIQAGSNDTVRTMEEGLEIVKSGSIVVSSSGETFDQIVQMVSEVSEQANRMEGIVSELSSGTSRIRDHIQEVDRMSQTIAEETSNVSAASEEQTAGANEIAAAAERLAKTASELQGFVSKFKL